MDTNDDDSMLLALAVEVYRRVANAGTINFTGKETVVAVGIPNAIAYGEAYKKRMQRKQKEYEMVYGTPLLVNASPTT
jgi:hypothetical protein